MGVGVDRAGTLIESVYEDTAMSTPVTIPNLNVVFPERCVCCSAPREEETFLTLTRGQDEPLRIPVPHCRRCARATRSVFLAGCVPFVGGGLLIGGGVFGIVTLAASAYGLDEMGNPNSFNSAILGSGAGLFAGFVGGFVSELLARVALLPFFGRALWQAPLLAAQFLNDSDHVAGLTMRPLPQGRGYQLTFSNEAIAQEFKRLNGLA